MNSPNETNPYTPPTIQAELTETEVKQAESAAQSQDRPRWRHLAIFVVCFVVELGHTAWVVPEGGALERLMVQVSLEAVSKP